MNMGREPLPTLLGGKKYLWYYALPFSHLGYSIYILQNAIAAYSMSYGKVSLPLLSKDIFDSVFTTAP